MSKVVHKKHTVTLAIAANQFAGSLDVTNCNGVSVQINGPAANNGQIKLQWSNDNTNWHDIAGATANINPGTSQLVNVPNLYAAHVQALVTVTAGAGEYNLFFLGKER